MKILKNIPDRWGSYGQKQRLQMFYKVFLNISKKFTTLLKSGSSTCVFCEFSKIFIKNHFYRISPDDGFCVGYIFKKYLSFNGLFQESYYY